MGDDLEFIVIDDIPEYIFCIGDDEENEQVIAIRGKDGAFKYEKVAELPTTGEDGVLYLVPKSHTTQTASGNPISVNITDNAGKIESLKLDGDTYQQSYTGKNLWEYSVENWVFSSTNVTYSIEDGKLSVLVAEGTYQNVAFKIELPDGEYTFSLGSVTSSNPNMTVKRMTLATRNTNMTNRTAVQHIDAGTPQTVTISNEPNKIYTLEFWGSYADSLENTATFSQVQVEAGSTATAYEPYVGGQASPSPSYPQDINVVTGTQTVSINGANYLIDLGSIELCKLGTYQDYIYKDGDSWKVHKTTVKSTLSPNMSWQTDRFSTEKRIYTSSSSIFGVTVVKPSANTQVGLIKSSHFSTGSLSDILDNTNGIGISSTAYISIADHSAISAQSIINVMTNNLVSAYAALPTATDTTITDQTLIAQLEAARTAALSTGSNTISNTTTGTNLAGDLEIGYYGYDPLNKYDKYFWLDIDGGYESL